MKPCLHCSEQITQRTARAAFCSRRCKARYANKTRTPAQVAANNAAAGSVYARKREESGRALLWKTQTEIWAFRRRVREHAAMLRQQERAARPTYPQKIKQFIIDYKTARGCQVCSIAAPAYILDLHHIDPATKVIDPSRAKSIPQATAEFAKCAVLCAIHHRMVEAGDIVLEAKES